MPNGTGLSSQLGIAPEVTWGTFVAPTRFYEFNDESLKLDVQKLRTRSLGDRYQRSSRVRTYVKGGGGDFTVDVMNIGPGLLYKAMLGAVVSAQVGSTPEWAHTFTPDPAGMLGQSWTVQVGRPTVAGVVVPMNYVGGKVVSWELTGDLDKNLALKLTWDFAPTNDDTSALAVQSLPAASVPLSFIDAVVTIDGVATSIKKFSIAGNNNLNTNRRFLSNTKKEALPAGELAITGTLDKEWEDHTRYDDFVAGTQAALVVTYAYGEIATTGNPFKLVVTCPAIEYTDDGPMVKNSDVLDEPLQFKALYNGTDPIVTLDFHTSDTAP